MFIASRQINFEIIFEERLCVGASEHTGSFIDVVIIVFAENIVKKQIVNISELISAIAVRMAVPPPLAKEYVRLHHVWMFLKLFFEFVCTLQNTAKTPNTTFDMEVSVLIIIMPMALYTLGFDKILDILVRPIKDWEKYLRPLTFAVYPANGRLLVP